MTNAVTFKTGGCNMRDSSKNPGTDPFTASIEWKMGKCVHPSNCILGVCDAK